MNRHSRRIGPSAPHAGFGVRVRAEDGMAMAALLVMLNVMAVALTVALPAWQTLARREKEAELIFRGEQYARAIRLYRQKYGGASPPSVDVLVTERLLRKKYLDPITGGEFELITPATAIEGSTTSPLLPRGGAAGARGGAAGARGGTGGASASGPAGFTLVSPGGGVAAARGGATGARGTQQGTTVARTFNLSGNTVFTAGATGGILGVRSKSKEKSLRLYNGEDQYDRWLFMPTQVSAGISAPEGGEAGRGSRGRGGAPGTAGRGQPQGGTRGRGGFTLTPPGSGGRQQTPGAGGRQSQPSPGRGFGGR